MIKNSRISFLLAVFLLLVAVVLRLWQINTLPDGLNDQEIISVRLAENVRQGDVQVFYDLGTESREGLYPTMLSVATGLVGGGTFGFRQLSVWLGMVTLALLYALVRRLYGYTAGLAATGLLAVNFWHILVSRMVGAQTLLPVLITGVMLALILGFPVYWRRRGSRTQTGAFGAMGVLLGLGFYVHPTGLVIALMALIFALYMLLVRLRPNRQTLSYLSFSALVMIIIATPYLISALRLPGLSGGTQLLSDLRGARAMLPQRALETLGLFAIQGDAAPANNIPLRPLLDPVSGALVLLGLATALRYIRKPRYLLPLVGLLVLLPLAITAPDAPSFMPLVASLPLLAMFFGLGVMTAARFLRSPLLVRGGLLALLGFNIVWTGRALFVLWPQLPAVQTAYHSGEAEIAHYLDRTAAEVPSVLCVPTLNAPPQPTLDPAQRITLMMNREGAVYQVDCRTGMLFVNGGARQQIIVTDAPPTTDPSILAWFAHAQPITVDRLADDDAVQVLTLEVTDVLADTIGRFTTTTPVSFTPEVGSAEIAAPPVRFGGNLTFLGYERPPEDAYAPGAIVPVVTYWRVDGPLPSDLQLFVHVLTDPDARPLAQRDTLSVVPAQLHDRDVFAQVTYVEVPASMPAGRYAVSIGAYQTSDAMRLPVLDAPPPGSDRLFLYPVVIETGP